MIAWRLDRSFAWNAAHVPKLPGRPRKVPAGPGAGIFGRRVECPIGVAAGPLPNSRWIEAYARLGYGLLTYKTVRTTARRTRSTMRAEIAGFSKSICGCSDVVLGQERCTSITSAPASAAHR
ncbi:MAG TPA: hypothetical protein VJA45_12195, partial [Methylomirabilota bacterium]|nr:hypothetical protein [Methylomirabilota bacterium]